MSCKTCNTNCIEAGTRDDQMCSAWTKRDDAVATDKNVAHKTNADRIRAMTDEELEEWLTAFVCSNVAPHATARGAAKKGRLLEWLKQEVE